MKRGRKRKAIIPESVSQHIEEEFKKDRDFRKAYSEEATRLQIGYKIAQLRKLRRLTQAELARRIATTQQTISRLEDSKNYKININTLVRIAAALRARLDIDLIPTQVNV
jgi:DNA-binding XRE family transcriptional regulator